MSVAGPLSLLQEAMAARQRVCVIVRAAQSLRGVCTGFLLGFDSHFNLVRARCAGAGWMVEHMR